MSTYISTNRSAYQQFARYVVAGLLSCGLDLGLFWLFYAIVQAPWVVANTGAMFLAVGFNFTANRLWAFGSTQPLGRQMRRYALLVAVNMVLSNAIIYVLSDFLTLDRILAKGCAIALIVSWNFFLYRYVIYR